MTDEAKIIDGGPAFPTVLGPPREFAHGMSLRDWLAGQALAGFCANTAVFAANSYNGWQLINCSDHDLARQCLALADAMLVERKGAGR